jgi:hypothetical protein
VQCGLVRAELLKQRVGERLCAYNSTAAGIQDVSTHSQMLAWHSTAHSHARGVKMQRYANCVMLTGVDCDLRHERHDLTRGLRLLRFECVSEKQRKTTPSRVSMDKSCADAPQQLSERRVLRRQFRIHSLQHHRNCGGTADA